MNRREAIKRTALLFGVAASPATITRALAEMSDTAGAARYLTSSQYKIVVAVAERLLPASDTPGATDAGVADYVDVVYGLFMSNDNQNSLRKGLAHLDRHEFDAKDGAKQDAIITSIAEDNTAPGKNWLRQFRSLAFNGYFSSEAAAKSGFNWDPVPGSYNPKLTLAEANGVSFFE